MLIERENAGVRNQQAVAVAPKKTPHRAGRTISRFFDTFSLPRRPTFSVSLVGGHCSGRWNFPFCFRPGRVNGRIGRQNLFIKKRVSTVGKKNDEKRYQTMGEMKDRPL